MKTGDKAKVTFKDFSDGPLPMRWLVDAMFQENVKVYWDRGNKAWCRQVDEVECVVVDGWYVPVHGQFIGYSQKIA